ncbi:MAG: four helix bundle protein [Cyclobacteriaceae bacterium]
MENWEELFDENLVEEPHESYQTRRNPLLEKSYQFALQIIKVSQELQKQNEFVISKQVVRSRTAIGALSEEAQQAESRADFIHKLSIANKEAHETHYWLRLLRDSGLVESAKSDNLLALAEELRRILIPIIKKAKQNK